MKLSYIFHSLLLFISSSCQAQQTITTINSDGSVTFLKSQNNTENIFITPNGNMGIGKKDPKDKLEVNGQIHAKSVNCLLYTSPSPRDQRGSRMPSSA